MTLLLTTLVAIGLSIMPMVMISKAAKIRQMQSKQGKKQTGGDGDPEK